MSDSPAARQDANHAGVGAIVARAVVTMSAAQAGVIATGFITSIAQARLLGALGRGDVTRFANASALSLLYFGLGINSGITYFVAAGKVERRALSRLLGRLYAVTLVAAIVAAALATATPLRRFLPHSLSLAESVAALAAFFALAQLSSWLAAFAAARSDFAPINTATLSVGVAGALGSSALLLGRPEWAGPRAIIALLLGLEVLRAAILAAFAIARSAAPQAMTATALQVLSARELLRYALLTYASESLQFLTYRFDMWVVDAWHGAAELGRYSLAVSLAQLVWIVPTAAARVLFPYASRLAPAEAAALVWRAARIALLASATAAALGLIGARFSLTALFGADFADVPGLLAILLLGIVPYALSKVLSIYLSAIGAVGLNVLLSAAGLAVTIALDLLLIPHGGAHGAAWATALSYTVFTALTLLAFIRRRVPAAPSA